MNDYYEVYGIVIKVQPVGEFDKRITLLTKERGRVSAFARGARRQGSSLMGVTRVFATGTFRLREGKDSSSLIQAKIDNYFESIASDVEATCYGMYFLELADYYARELLSEPQMIRLLYISLLALTKESLPNKLVRRIYELRLMVIDGRYDENPPGDVSDTCVYAWGYIIKSPLEKLYTFALTDEVFNELEECVSRSIRKYVDRKMNSLEVLETLAETKKD